MTEAVYLDLSAEELKKRNTDLKRDREMGFGSEVFEEKITAHLKDNTSVVAISICFTDLEGKLHILDYNKDFFLDSRHNLTFDGSSIRGFSRLAESDLRLFPDWTSFRWLPASIFGTGKVLMFGKITNQDGSVYESDMRTKLSLLLEDLKKEKNMRMYVAPEIEGHLLEDTDAEQNYFRKIKTFKLATVGGYFSSLPCDDLRQFIDRLARVLGMLGFENEKDHPEVSPAEFEVNFRYADAITAADQTLLYKLVARQVAKSMGFTASFLPKPVTGVNGNGMHTNMSLAQNGKNIFYDAGEPNFLSQSGKNFAAGILHHAKELCLVMNSSVNSYRRLDPNYEAPNAIKMSSKDRGSMIRIPIGNEKSARIEVRSPSPDANPYLLYFAFLHAGLEGIEKGLSIPAEGEILPSCLYEAIGLFKNNEFMRTVLGESVHQKYWQTKEEVDNRSPRGLGTIIKTSEVIFHHEVRNQYLWSQF